MAAGLLLGATALYLLARPLSNPRESLDLVSCVLAINRLALLSAARVSWVAASGSGIWRRVSSGVHDCWPFCLDVGCECA